MVDWNHKDFFVCFVCLCFSHIDFSDQNVRLITIAVENSEVQNSNSMNFLNIKLMGSQISSDIMTFHKLLQWAMLGLQGFEICLGSTLDGNRINNFFVVKRRMVKLHVSGCWNFMKPIDI